MTKEDSQGRVRSDSHSIHGGGHNFIGQCILVIYTSLRLQHCNVTTSHSKDFKMSLDSTDHIIIYINFRQYSALISYIIYSSWYRYKSTAC